MEHGPGKAVEAPGEHVLEMGVLNWFLRIGTACYILP